VSINNEPDEPVDGTCDYCGEAETESLLYYMGEGQRSCRACRRESPDDAYDNYRADQDEVQS
jgi:hypothetical protein